MGRMGFFHLNEFIVPAAQADLFPVFQSSSPLGVGVGGQKVVVGVVTAVSQVLAEDGVGQRVGFQAGISTGLVDGHRVEGGKHADVGQDGRVVAAIAVADRGHVLDQTDMEVGTAIADRLGVLGHLLVQQHHGAVLHGVDGVKVAGANAAAAADAVVGVDLCLAVLTELDAVVGTAVQAMVAATTAALADPGLALGVLLHLACPAAAAHAQVLDGAAEAGGLVAFEVGQADDDVGIHDGVADLGVLHQLAVVYRHCHLVGASQAVTDDDGTAAGDVVEPVLCRCQQVLQGVLPATRIEGVAVGEEGLAAQLLHHVHHRSGVVGTQEG